MELTSIDLSMKRVENKEFIKKAASLAPTLQEQRVHPRRIVTVVKNEDAYPDVVERDVIEHLSSYHLKKGDKIILDFGNHFVGYVTLDLTSVGSPQDAPAFLKVKFAEHAKELTEDSADYDGWISRGWIQEEYIHIDVLPEQLDLKRRYAFRYLEVEVIDTSVKWQLVIEDVTLRAVSSVNEENVRKIETGNPLLQRIDEVSLRTLQNCMQDVFEDGPKRDRRLWLGDLRLQALANYETFRHTDLVKRCLYLFAGQTKDTGQISACLFTEPKVIVDDTFFMDYSLFFGAVLLDYYEATGDMDTLRELSPSAYRQLEISGEFFDERDLLTDEIEFLGFIDWTEGLERQTALQGVYIYCAGKLKRIAEILGDTDKASFFEGERQKKLQAARTYLFDKERGLFLSGQSKQINYASQVWMVLADPSDRNGNKELLQRVMELDPEKGMVSPYMNHHFTEALIQSDMAEEAMEHMKYYWGGMIEKGADTFWELYNPKNPAESPYGSSIVNSYCHAWSCTPTYLIRKYQLQ